MTILSGFFNSVGGDRMYDATNLNDFMNGFITEGVLSTVGDSLIVTAPGGAMVVNVGTGKAWFLETYLINTQTRAMSIANGDPTHPRKDLVVLDFNLDARTNTISVLTGTPASSPAWPTLIDNATRKQVPIAVLDIDAGATEVVSGDITNLIGGIYCPLCTGLLQQMTVEDLNNHWNADYASWKAGIEADLQEIDTTGTLAEIQDMRERPIKYRNIIINGDMSINQRGTSTVTGWDSTDSAADPYIPIVDRWQLDVESNSGAYTLQRNSLGNGRYGTRITCTTPTNLFYCYEYAIFRQPIESNRLLEAYKGTTDAKSLTLSFDAKTNVGGAMIMEIVDQDNGRSISHLMLLMGDNAYHRYSHTFPPDFTGPWNNDNGTGAHVNFWLAAGSDFDAVPQLQSSWATITTGKRAVGQYNFANTANNYVEFTDIQLEVGTVDTEMERRGTTTELELCKRYREFFTEWVSGPCTGDTTAGYRIGGVGPNYEVKKRAIPTASYSSVGWATVTGFLANSFAGATSFNLIHTSKDVTTLRPIFYVTPITSITQDKSYFVAVANLLFDAEL